MTLAKRVRKLRKDKGWSLELLAKKTGHSKSYIWELEHNNNVNPSAGLVHRLAIAFDTSMEYLLVGRMDENTVDTIFIRAYLTLTEDDRRVMRKVMATSEP